MQFEVQAA